MRIRILRIPEVLAAELGRVGDVKLGRKVTQKDG